MLSVCLSVCVSVLLSVCQAVPMYPNALDYYRDIVPTEPEVNPNWPSGDVQFGQVAAIEAGADNKVYVFHRADRTWGFESFLGNNVYAHPEQGAIADPTIVVLDASTGKNISAMGKNRFYMPHGLTLDNHGNLWVTDVALHQVMRFPAGSEEPDVVLGEKLVPGNDDKHFCKPTDVAVLSNGDFFVSDGYCNSRIMKFSKEGKLLKTWGEAGKGGQLSPNTLLIPHSLALVEKEDMICVADREDSRVQCYNAGMKDASKTGDFVRTLFPRNAAGKVYAIAYDTTYEVMYVVTKPDTNVDHARGFTVSLAGQGLEEWWIDNKGTSLPHDVSVSEDGKDIYVADVLNRQAVKLQRFAPPA